MPTGYRLKCIFTSQSERSKGGDMLKKIVVVVLFIIISGCLYAEGTIDEKSLLVKALTGHADAVGDVAVNADGSWPDVTIGSSEGKWQVVVKEGTPGKFTFGTHCKGYYGAGGPPPLDILLPGETPPEGTDPSKNQDLLHMGVDIVASEGCTIYPIANGTVVSVITQATNAAAFDAVGNAVIIKHDSGKIWSLYCHMRDVPSAIVTVTAGVTPLGVVGHTPYAEGTFGPHVHLEVRRFSQLYYPGWSPQNIYGKVPAMTPKTMADLEADLNAQWINPMPNSAPNAPATSPAGTGTGAISSSYSYTALGADPDGNQIKYRFDWGDASTTDTDYVNSGTSAAATHAFTIAGTYAVKAKTIDSHSAISANWSPVLSVIIENASAGTKKFEFDTAGSMSSVTRRIHKVVNVTFEAKTRAEEWAYKGRALFLDGKNQEAVECYDKAISLNPNDSGIWLSKSLNLSVLGKEEDARECHRKAMELAVPDNPVLHNFAENILNSYPSGSILIVSGDAISLGLDYLQIVEKKRTDIIVVDQELLTYPWYCEQKRKSEPTLIIPFLMYNDTHPISEFVEANYERHKIYFTGLRDSSLNEKYWMLGQGLLRVVKRISGDNIIDVNELRSENDNIWSKFNMKEVVSGKYEPSSQEAELVTIYAKARHNQGWSYGLFADKALDMDKKLGNKVSKNTMKLFGYSEYEYLQAIKIDPLFLSPYKNLGIIYANVYKNKNKTIAIWKKFLELAPENSEAEEIRAELTKLQCMPD